MPPHLAATGAAEVVRQINFTPDRPVGAAAPGAHGVRRLDEARGEAAKSAGVTDAAERLADLTLHIAGMIETPKTAQPEEIPK